MRFGEAAHEFGERLRDRDPVIRVVALDVDDTLVQTEAACFETNNEVLARLGRAPMGRETHLATGGQPLPTAIALRSPGVDVAELLPLFVHAYQEYLAAKRVDVVPSENLRAVDALRGRGLNVTVLTAVVEVKKIYTAPDFRRAGLGWRIPYRLEQHAACRGARQAILETGSRSHAALALSGGSGYLPTARYVSGRDRHQPSIFKDLEVSRLSSGLSDQRTMPR